MSGEQIRAGSATSSGLARDPKANRAPKFVLGAGAALCMLCCAAPLLIGAGIGGSALIAFAAHAEAVALGLLVTAVVTYFLLRYRARTVVKEGAACSVDCASRPRDRPVG
jgi:hypothetical protein